MAEIEGFDGIDNALVTNDVLSLEALISNHNASKERETEKESPVIIAPKIINLLDALETIRTFYLAIRK